MCDEKTSLTRLVDELLYHEILRTQAKIPLDEKRHVFTAVVEIPNEKLDDYDVEPIETIAEELDAIYRNDRTWSPHWSLDQVIGTMTADGFKTKVSVELMATRDF